MEKKIVQFKGMSNVPDDQVAQDGQMAVLMNARIKNGEIVPYQRPENSWSVPDVKQMLFHQNSGYWLILDVNGKLSVYEYGATSAKMDIKESDVESFSVMGNIIIMNIKNDTVYAIYKGNVFVYLGAVPAPPEMSIKNTAFLHSEKSTDGLTLENYYMHSKGLFDKCLNSIYLKGGFIDNAIFIVAIRFFDATYRYSHWYFVRNEDKETFEMTEPNFSTSFDFEIDRDTNFLTTGIHLAWASHINKTYFANHVLGFYPEFHFDFDLSEWENIIESVDIFSSGSIMEHEVITDTTFGEGYSKINVPRLRENIENCSTFYKIAEYDLKGNFVYRITNTSPSNMAVQKTLPVENRREYLVEKEIVFNNRRHIVVKDEKKEIATDNVMSMTGSETPIEGDYPSYIEYENKDVMHYTLKKIYNQAHLPYLISQPMRGVIRQEVGLVGSKLDIKYKSHSIMDVSIALNGSAEYDCWADSFTTGFANNISYVDLYKDNNSQEISNVRFNPRIDFVTFLSTAFDVLGYAEKYQVEIYSTYVAVRTFETFVNLDYKTASDWGILFEKYVANTYITITVIRKTALYTIEKFVYEGTSLELKDEHKIPVVKNTIMLSEVDNPFYFPVAQTYQFDGDIVAMASNAEAISQGQFGQFPLFVFTTQGIWAMQVDSTGKTAYSTQVPFSREVCSGGVCVLSGGVVFATDKGVMIISGGQVVNLSQVLDAQVAELFKNSGELVDKIFKRADGGLSVARPVPIREYVKNAKLAYNYLENELVVSNKDYKFSYIYKLDSQTWSMIDTVFDLTTNSYPELVVINSDTGNILEFKNGRGNNKIVAITRPIKTDSFDYKRLRQAALRTTFKGSLNFYILGSNDGATFSVITGKEYPSKDGNEPTDVMRRDLVTTMSRSRQYKYFAIAIAGNMEGRISMAELLMDAGFANNKLR